VSSTSSSLRMLGIALVIVGVLALAVGVVYFTVQTDKLPSFMGQVAKLTGHRTKRGLAALVGGVVLVIAGSFSLARSKG